MNLFETHDIEGLLKLFYIDKKKELVKHCKNLVIYKADFAGLIMTCNTVDVGYRHKIYYRDIVPDHLEPTTEEFEAFSNNSGNNLEGKAAKLISKVSQIFKDRRYLVGHMFFTQNLTYWHFFYFDQRDHSKQDNHWHRGPHIHFINYLWPCYNAQDIWNRFTKGNPQMRESIHIKYVDSVCRVGSAHQKYTGG